MGTDPLNSKTSASTLGTVAIMGAAYVAIAWLVIEFIQKRPFLTIFKSQTSVTAQLLIGFAAGSTLAAVQYLLLRFSRHWNEAQRRVVGGSAALLRSPLAILGLALLVGITEEVMFRAAIQPLTGIWMASVLFTAVHLGNLDWRDIEGKIDGPVAIASVGSIFAASLMVGSLFDSFGLLSAMAAHFIYDTVVLFAYRGLLSD